MSLSEFREQWYNAWAFLLWAWESLFCIWEVILWHSKVPPVQQFFNTASNDCIYLLKQFLRCLNRYWVEVIHMHTYTILLNMEIWTYQHILYFLFVVCMQTDSQFSDGGGPTIHSWNISQGLQMKWYLVSLKEICNALQWLELCIFIYHYNKYSHEIKESTPPWTLRFYASGHQKKTSGP